MLDCRRSQSRIGAFEIPSGRLPRLGGVVSESLHCLRDHSSALPVHVRVPAIRCFPRRLQRGSVLLVVCGSGLSPPTVVGSSCPRGGRALINAPSCSSHDRLRADPDRHRAHGRRSLHGVHHQQTGPLPPRPSAGATDRNPSERNRERLGVLALLRTHPLSNFGRTNRSKSAYVIRMSSVWVPALKAISWSRASASSTRVSIS